ncbi:histidine kinase N-terminal 7TM domain-containing protein [Haloarcula nitratireducens]|uniref:histidine kinase n=1 Tax=Haloarcula nitratireducens TaxID=2487749 RepID=A0AAW4PBK0_9EURY|nr:histidine kinase N-terminal 7TM domain-containing protein [Halomicroarcula nitratireducens]MBX0295269.1 PAS domain-containing protein [Halomicroarcula nitratireducens]
MSLVFAVYVVAPLVTIVIGGVLAAWVYTHHRSVRGSDWFLLHLVAGIGWMGAFLAHVVLQDAELQILAAILSSKLSAWAFIANIVFASVYSESDFHRHPLAKVALGGIALSTLIPTWIAPFQSIFYREFVLVSRPFHHVVAEKTPFYELVGLVLAILATYGLLQLVRYMLTTPRRSRAQLTLFVLGTLSVMFAIVAEDGIWFLVEGLSTTEFGVLPYVVCVSLALFRFRLFDVLPVARNAVVEALRDPVFVLDGERRLVDFNDAALTILPGAGDRIGEAFADVHPTLAAGIDFGPEAADAPARLTLDVGGDTRHYSVNVSRVDDDGGDVDWYSILLRDVTDLERSRWQLAKQNERLEQVASTISHDLRNPINVADGYAEFLDEQLAGDSLSGDELDAARENLTKTRESHERMGEIIEDVLTLARGGKTVGETEPVSLSTTAWEAWENVETGDAKLSLTGERTVEVDRSKLLSVFENLFRNSVEHGSTGSRTQSDDSVEHGSTDPRSQTREDGGEHGPSGVTVTVEAIDGGFAVADDGPGIPAVHCERIFEDGYTTGEDGTGLGLSIVRTMAESHGWTVELDGDADGARFVFSTADSPSSSSVTRSKPPANAR